MERILVMEDDISVKNELITLLHANGYKTVDAPPCELALLDINMPLESGLEVCRKLRLSSDIPVIFLTARESPEDELLAFGVGADDYIRKPYNSSVLLARISRLLKRKNASVLSLSGLTLDFAAMTVSMNGNTAELTKNETRILACLMKKDLCTKQEIIEDLWQNSLYIDENTLYVNIQRLRKKLKEIGASTLIRTVRGVGYRL
ncbi:MAG TPA: response regulator transcription factor [Firmicutes bacterium]|nr:response regulator transcription factor [Bacillota bacterium]